MTQVWGAEILFFLKKESNLLSVVTVIKRWVHCKQRWN